MAQITQTLSTPPTPPDPAVDDQTAFSNKASAFNQWEVTHNQELQNLIPQMNQLASDVSAGVGSSMRFNFSNLTTNADPGNGFIRLSSATQSSSAQIRMDLLDANGADLTALIDSFDDSTSTHKGILRLQHATDVTKWIIFNVTGISTATGYRNINITLAAASTSSPFANNDPVIISFSRTGDLASGAVSSAALQKQTYSYFTTGGTATAYTLTPTPSLGNYAAGTSFLVTFHTNCGDAPTMNISSLGILNLVKRTPEGYYDTIYANDIPYQWTSRITLIDTVTAVVEELPPAVGYGSSVSYRNKFRNPEFTIDQKGLMPWTGQSTNYVTDGWCYNANIGNVTISRQATILPSDQEFGMALKILVNSAVGSLAAGNYCHFYQPIEGYLVYDLIAKAFCVKFRINCSKTGTFTVSFRNSGADRSYVVPFTVNAANTWQKVIIKIPTGLITAGTWNWTSGTGVIFSICMAAGSSFQSPAGGYTWETGSYLGVSGQANFLDTVGATMYITGFQMERGSIPGPFEHRDMETEWAFNRRYFQIFHARASGQYSVAAAGASAVIVGNFSPPMRTTPTLGYGGVNTAVNAQNELLEVINYAGWRYGIQQAASAGNFYIERVNNTASSEL